MTFLNFKTHCSVAPTDPINDTGATRSGWNGEDDNASLTLVLNIVAQVPPSEVEKSKADDISTKKKVNKFDRRRRRRARELEQQQRAENNLRVEDGGENNPREGRAATRTPTTAIQKQRKNLVRSLKMETMAAASRRGYQKRQPCPRFDRHQKPWMRHSLLLASTPPLI